MKVVYGIGRLKITKPSVVTVGVFDGVHRGHQHIVRAVVALAKKNNLASIVITFYPHPDIVTQRAHSLPLLISLEHRVALIGSLGVDVCVVMPFTPAIRSMSAIDFVQKILLKKCRMRHLVTHRAFVFGRGQEGRSALLTSLSKTLHFGVHFQRGLKVGKKMIRSSLIRKLILTGNLSGAARLLGRPVEVIGTVVGGDSRGRKLGFPTANIDPHHEVIPPRGVYCVIAYIDNHAFEGVANIGFRPTFTADKKETIELHLISFQSSLYGKKVRIVFSRKIRPELKFKDPYRLAAQIKRDIDYTHRFFSR